ncbi:MAG: hypothetical protein COW08_03550 [Ignavibacteriales bacterium CG12_big_fil_rev_8_21_14_0_65_30_8]|nr:MAG: hypothetical protein COW08_03550 [Ignavibacteriales bacterium CG12_big_fil_rev_8_21_14_0_65_30_8]
MNNKAFEEIKYFNFANYLKKLGESLQKDISDVCKKRNSNLDPSLFPILYYLNLFEKSTVQNLADNLQITHPAVIQSLRKLNKLGLIETRSGTQDKRESHSFLSKKGKQFLKEEQDLFNDIEEVNKEIISESGYDVFNMIDSVKNLLTQNSYAQRMDEKVKQKLMKSVEIITYNKKYKEIFKKLNYEWLEEYFNVEDKDEKLLNEPEKYIIKKGGQIFFARINNEIVGTSAAIKIDRQTYELSKMAVTKKAQGKQAGKKLALAVIGFAYSKNAKYVTLLTNKKLYSAINLYKKLGFETNNEEEKSNYERKVFRMTLLLQ